MVTHEKHLKNLEDIKSMTSLEQHHAMSMLLAAMVGDFKKRGEIEMAHACADVLWDMFGIDLRYAV